jgi:polyribonucleotide nucleotidyltransferase
MMHRIKLTGTECELIREIISKNSVELEIKEENNTSFILEISDSEASNLSEILKDAYTFEGFDVSYSLTQKGKVYEGVIDKFVEIGW